MKFHRPNSDRCTGRCAFARFALGSCIVGELVFFFKVDLLIYCDCTVECVDHW